MIFPQPWGIEFPGRTIDEIWQWVFNNIANEPEHMADIWKQPEETLRDRKGDCEDRVILALARCNLIGVKASMVTGILSFPSDGRFGHAWLETDTGRIIETHHPGCVYIPEDRFTSIIKVMEYIRWAWYYRLMWQIWLWFK